MPFVDGKQTAYMQLSNAKKLFVCQSTSRFLKLTSLGPAPFMLHKSRALKTLVLKESSRA